MIDLDLIARWAIRASFVVLFLLWRIEARQNERLIALAETSVATTADCVVSYRESAAAMQQSVRSMLGIPPMVLVSTRTAE